MEVPPRPTATVAPAEATGVRPRNGMRELLLENVQPLRLRLLLEIERTGSISAAATACAIAQPSASAHLRTLETATGQRLVARHGRGSRLTLAGQVVASHAERVLASLDSMRRGLDELDGGGACELSVAASLTASLVLLPAILHSYSERYPGVRVNLRTNPSHAVVEEVMRGEAELGVAAEVPTAEPVISRHLLTDELIGIAPPGLAEFDHGPVNAAELSHYTLLMGSTTSSTRLMTERFLRTAGLRPTRVWEFDSYEAITRAVADGAGVSFTSRLLVGEALERGELVGFRLRGVAPMLRPMYAVQSGTRALTVEGTAFMELLQAAAAKLDGNESSAVSTGAVR